MRLKARSRTTITTDVSYFMLKSLVYTLSECGLICDFLFLGPCCLKSNRFDFHEKCQATFQIAWSFMCINCFALYLCCLKMYIKCSKMYHSGK